MIHATRRAAALVGVDSGPLHLAAALGKPGVAIFGPTDPARNGPYGDSFRVLRTPEPSRRRTSAAHAIDPSMWQHLSGRSVRGFEGDDGGAPASCGKPGRMMDFPKPYADAVARLRVPSGFLIVVVFAWFSQPDADVAGDWDSALAARPGAARLGGRMPGEEPGTRYRRAVRLHAESALYRHAAGGGGVGSGLAEYRLAVLFAAVFLLVYLPVIQKEEQHLRRFSRVCGVCEAGADADPAA